MDGDEKPADDTPAAELARRLDYLFKTVRRPNGGKYFDYQLAEFVTQATGEPCSRFWISRLRKGDIPAPELARLHAIAKFFDVSAAYFFDDTFAEGVQSDIATVLAIKKLAAHGVDPRNILDVEARGIPLRDLTDLEPEDLTLVKDLVDRLTAARRQRDTTRPRKGRQGTTANEPPQPD